MEGIPFSSRKVLILPVPRRKLTQPLVRETDDCHPGGLTRSARATAPR